MGLIIYQIRDKNQNNIANGILHQTSKLAIGESIDTCQKLIIIIGRVKLKADKVRIKLSLIAMNFGKNPNIFSKNF